MTCMPSPAPAELQTAYAGLLSGAMGHSWNTAHIHEYYFDCYSIYSYVRVLHRVGSHLQALKVLQHDISNALVVSFYVSIRASFPETDKHQKVFISETLWSHCRQ